ncbi:MAG: sugar phosphate isomerase/epimerase family protein [Chloroflexota bacterium]
MTDWKKRLAIVSDEAAASFTEAVAVCRPLGIRAFELRNFVEGRFPDIEDRTVEEILTVSQQESLTLLGVSPGFFKGTVEGEQTERAFQVGFSKAFRLIDRLGVRRLAEFSFKREGGRDTPIPSNVVERLQQAADLCRQEGIELIIENSADSWGDTGANLADLAQKVGVRVTWDPGNAAASGETAFPDGYQVVRDHIAHIHFKNWTSDEGNVAINAGVVDFAGQVSALKADSYDGYYCIEPHQWHDRANATRLNTKQLLALLSSND